MAYILDIRSFIPVNEQEETDQKNIIQYCSLFNDLLYRENTLAHFTVSPWIVNKERTKVLMIYHKIYQSWSWTGGHADGCEDFLNVALKEAKEETGVDVRPVSREIYALDILHVPPHKRKGVFVSAHVHLNITYLCEASEQDTLVLNEDETNGVMWIPIEDLDRYISPNDADMLVVYHKLIYKMKEKNNGKD